MTRRRHGLLRGVVATVALLLALAGCKHRTDDGTAPAHPLHADARRAGAAIERGTEAVHPLDRAPDSDSDRKDRQAAGHHAPSEQH